MWLVLANSLCLLSVRHDLRLCVYDRFEKNVMSHLRLSFTVNPKWLIQSWRQLVFSLSKQIGAEIQRSWWVPRLNLRHKGEIQKHLHHLSSSLFGFQQRKNICREQRSLSWHQCFLWVPLIYKTATMVPLWLSDTLSAFSAICLFFLGRKVINQIPCEVKSNRVEHFKIL